MLGKQRTDPPSSGQKEHEMRLPAWFAVGEYQGARQLARGQGVPIPLFFNSSQFRGVDGLLLNGSPLGLLSNRYGAIGS